MPASLRAVVPILLRADAKVKRKARVPGCATLRLRSSSEGGGEARNARSAGVEIQAVLCSRGGHAPGGDPGVRRAARSSPAGPERGILLEPGLGAARHLLDARRSL